MLRIGITGGMGSGKSIVARIFEILGVPVYYADEASKRLMVEDKGLKNNIIEAFGEESFIGLALNRKFLSEAVFNNSEKLALLNSLVHPVTIKDAESWMNIQQAPYVLKEAALIFESGSHQYLDFVVGVESPTELRIKRTTSRDGISVEMVKARMEKQMDEEEKMRLCSFIIKNDEQHLLLPQVLQLHEKFSAME